MKPLTLGTAGHIDHGKTALIRALTGVDTDRLPEERARGISIELGDELEVLPQARRVRVRGVQVHDQPVDRAPAGQRVAVNLTGLATTDIERGDVLVSGDGDLRPSYRLDAELEFSPDDEPEHGDRVQ